MTSPELSGPNDRFGFNDFRYHLYATTYAFWWLRLLAGVFIAFNFFTFEDSRLRLAAGLLLLMFIAQGPYILDGYGGFLQWVLSKLGALWLAFVLYRCAKSHHFGNMKEIK